MNDIETLRKVKPRLRSIEAIMAQRDYFSFVQSMQPSYTFEWFHKSISDKLQKVYSGEIKLLMIFIPPQHGKFLKYDTPVFTIKGFKRHCDLIPGDIVFDIEGNHRRIISNSGTYIWNTLIVNFASGRKLIASPEHEWIIYADHDDNKGRVKELLETKDIFKRRNRRNPYIPINKPIEFTEKQFLIDPYILGIWLGDGTSANGAITCGSEDIKHFGRYGRCKEVKKGIYRITIPGLQTKLRKLSLLKNKHIPKEYLSGSIEQRMQLIRGLMDTDGTCCKKGRCDFVQNDNGITEDLYTLLRSVGIKPNVVSTYSTLYGRKINKIKRMMFTVNKGIKIFNLNRKQERIDTKIKVDRTDKEKFFIESIEENGLVQGNCIQVEGGIYLAGYDMIPTHNSELASRLFPAWCLGKNPKLKLVGASYSADLAQSFSRNIQRMIDSPIYHRFFPETYLNNSNVRADSKGSFLRNADIFEIVGKGGSYKAVGVCGSLTGNPADIAIIDDPVKDAIEAYSETYRERVWDWYLNVLRTRLHNDSRVILIMTRWHSDDLAGRLLQDAKQGGEQWDILCLPYVKEGLPTEGDNRNEGEALWPVRHSLEKAIQTQRMSLKVYNSLYQQRPAAIEGSIFKYNWFKRFTFEQLNQKEAFNGDRAIWNFVADTAYEDKERNDPSALLAYSLYHNELYIADVARVYLQMPELISFTKEFVKRNKYTIQSFVKIEPKASGKSLCQMLRNETGLNVSEGIAPTKDKTARAEICVPFVESGKVHLLEGSAWVDMFLDEVCTFPNGRHDDILDCFTMTIKQCQSDDIHYFGFSMVGT